MECCRNVPFHWRELSFVDKHLSSQWQALSRPYNDLPFLIKSIASKFHSYIVMANLQLLEKYTSCGRKIKSLQLWFCSFRGFFFYFQLCSIICCGDLHPRATVLTTTEDKPNNNLNDNFLARICRSNKGILVHIEREKTHNGNPHTGRKSLLLFILWYKWRVCEII